MIPRIYSANEYTFANEGLGSLPDAIECTVTEELNSSYELNMTYPIGGWNYDLIQANRIILAKPNDTDQAQPFDIKTIERSMDGLTAIIYATHVKHRGSEIPVAPFTATGAKAALEGLLTNSMISNPFSFVNHLTNSKSVFRNEIPTSLSECLKGSSDKDSIASKFSANIGIEYKYDRFDIEVQHHRGEDHGVAISYGKNLTDLTQETSIEECYTGVIAFYRKEEANVMVSGEIQYCEYHASFPRENIYILDASSDYDNLEEGTYPTEADLTERAANYVKNNNIGVPDVSVDVSFIELSNTPEFEDIAMLEHVLIGDTVSVRFTELGVTATAEVKKAEFDVLNEQYNSIKLGKIKATVADVVASKSDVASSISTVTNRIENVQAKVEREIKEATSSILGGSDGHVVMRNADGVDDITREQIFAYDGDSLSTASDVLVINHEGIAGTDQGINGTFKVAITTSGEINGQAIMANTIDGNSIQANTITVGNLNSELNEEINSIQTKSTIFYTQPVPPYNVNDLWCQGTTQQESTTDDEDTESSSHDILICITSRTKDETFNEADWALASNYTDDTIANDALVIANDVNSSIESTNANVTQISNSIENLQGDVDSSSAKINELDSSVTTISGQVESINNSLSGYAKKSDIDSELRTKQEDIDTLRTLVNTINDSVNTAQSVLQRITLNGNGIKVETSSDGSCYTLIQSDGIREYQDGKLTASYLVDYANANSMIFPSGQIGKHLIEKFTINDVEGTAFFYNDKA